MSDDKREGYESAGVLAFDGEWNETLGVLCRELVASKSSPDAREKFFETYRRACKRVATSLLGGWKWRGDIQRDAEDITSESVKILLGQEARCTGLFGSSRMDTDQLRGYLSRTIWRSCTQIAMRMQRRVVLVSLDQLIETGWDWENSSLRSPQELRAEISEILCFLDSSRSKFRKIPEALSLLECMQSQELGDAELKAIKKRTLQRYVKQIRECLEREFDPPGDP